MFKKLSKKSAMLFAGVLAVCALSMPAMAPAAIWDGVGSNHVLDSSNPANRISYSVAALGAGWTCGITDINIDIRSPTDAIVTNAVYASCMGTGSAVNCTVTNTGTSFPWTMTNTGTADVTIHGENVDFSYENTPGAAQACGVPGENIVTGSLHTGVWNQATHEITYTNATGLSVHTSVGTFPVTVTGTLRDTAQTLTLTD